MRLMCLLDRVPPERETYAYAEGKWTIRQIVGHLIDGERVFGYRALCIARGETQDLPGFDQDEYMPNAPYEHVELEDLLSEFRLVRLSNIAMLRTLDETAWTRMGMANGAPVSVRALVYIMVGHVRHHMGVLRERYQIGGARLSAMNFGFTRKGTMKGKPARSRSCESLSGKVRVHARGICC